MFLILLIEMGESKQSPSLVRAACAGMTLLPPASLGDNLSFTELATDTGQSQIAAVLHNFQCVRVKKGWVGLSKQLLSTPSALF